MRSNIAAAINAAHAGVEAAKREGARYAVECGRLLVEAKDTVPHGGWDAWLRLNTTVSPRTAQLYMRIARHVEGDPAKAQRVAGLTVREAAMEAAGAPRSKAARKPLSPEDEASLAELNQIWERVRSHPEVKEMFAREIYRRGDITREQRDNIIRAAYRDPTIDAAGRRAAGQRLLEMMKRELPPGAMADLKSLGPALAHVTGEDLGIAIGDALEKRRTAGA